MPQWKVKAACVPTFVEASPHCCHASPSHTFASTPALWLPQQSGRDQMRIWRTQVSLKLRVAAGALSLPQLLQYLLFWLLFTRVSPSVKKRLCLLGLPHWLVTVGVTPKTTFLLVFVSRVFSHWISAVENNLSPISSLRSCLMLWRLITWPDARTSMVCTVPPSVMTAWSTGSFRRHKRGSKDMATRWRALRTCVPPTTT